MIESEFAGYEARIMAIPAGQVPKFGKLTAPQMICHLTDQLRMAFGEIEVKRQEVDLVRMREMVANNETVQTCDGLDQVGGEGTRPTEFTQDKETLLAYLDRFEKSPDGRQFSFHPFLGEQDRPGWARLVRFHLDHHLGQFE